MRLLLDTHVVLWWISSSYRLAPAIVEAIEEGANEVAVSAVTVWESALKRSKGKLDGFDDLLERLHWLEVRRLAVSFEHAEASCQLPMHHRDPFDRMLVAQAQIEGYTIVTSDAVLGRYAVPVLAATS